MHMRASSLCWPMMGSVAVFSLLSPCTDAENTAPRIENFQEVTTVIESIQNIVAFSFELFTGNLSDSIADLGIFQLQWETANKSSSSLITLTVTKDHGFTQANHTTEGAVTYRFTVDVTKLGEGPLLLALTFKLKCLHYSSYSCNEKPRSRCTCSQWQYRGESETILISAKKGNSK